MTDRVASREPQGRAAAWVCGKTRNSRIAGIKAALFLGFLAVAARPAFSASPDAGKILREVSAVYSRLQDYHLVAVVKESAVRPGTTSSRRSVITLDAAGAGRVRMSLTGGSSNLLLVSDGGTTWRYAPAQNEYTEREMSAAVAEPGAQEQNDLLGQMQDLLVGHFGRLWKLKNAVTFKGSAKVQFQGRKVPCYRIVLHWKDLTEQLWIEKSSFLVLRETETHLMGTAVGLSYVSGTLDVTEINAHATHARSFFTFTPPAGARRVLLLDLPGVPKGLVGSPAGDFTLPDLGGRQISLSDFRGKTVVLSFWATWCTPCRKELPEVEKIYEQYKDKNVVVLAVDDENQATVRSFLKDHHYGFTALVDQQRTLFKKFVVRYIPTVFVINGKGIIVRHIVGLENPEQLLEAIKAGEE
ncbi:MAG TPA: redoxin domain-containing protein [Terriglobia bacterium]|nr:redoxin domain-containing protein [Terriglobia bacterium]